MWSLEVFKVENYSPAHSAISGTRTHRILESRALTDGPPVLFSIYGHLQSYEYHPKYYDEGTLLMKMKMLNSKVTRRGNGEVELEGEEERERRKRRRRRSWCR